MNAAARVAALCISVFLASCSGADHEDRPLNSGVAHFLDRLSSSQEDRWAVADSFFNVQDRTPLVEADSIVTFLFRGPAQTVAVAGDPTGWSPDKWTMTRLPETDLWHYQTVLPPDARIDYKIVVDDTLWILDPNNPDTIGGGYGANSQLSMPRYSPAVEIVERPLGRESQLEDLELSSEALGDRRHVKVYLPAGYADRSDSLGLVIFHDGSDWLNHGRARVVLDNLIYDGTIDPVIAAFVDPVERFEEYVSSQRSEYIRFIVDELIPAIDRRYRTIHHPYARSSVGVSAGALIATEISLNRPDVVGLVAAFSPAYWVRDWSLVEDVRKAPVRPVRFYLDWGIYEADIRDSSLKMRSAIQSRRYDVIFREWPEGHSWGSWRAHLDEALRQFYGSRPPV